MLEKPKRRGRVEESEGKQRIGGCTRIAKRDGGSVGGRQKAEVKGVGCDEVGCGGEWR